MDAITNLVATVALLLAMATGGDATKDQVKASSPSATRGAASRPLHGCDDEFGCGMNHNETLVLDDEPMK